VTNHEQRDYERQLTALHEAAHAVTAHTHQLRFTDVTIQPGVGYAGRCVVVQRIPSLQWDLSTPNHEFVPGFSRSPPASADGGL
jgi:hypothetical protein